MGTVVDYLRVARAQTAAVEGAGFPLAAWIGGAPLWTLPLFALLGILAHFGGFGENGLTDLAYDRLDPSKTDHPLVSGRMRFGHAFAFVYLCQLAGILAFIGLALDSPAAHFAMPVAAFVGYIALGHVYNLWGKAWKPGAVLEISGAFALAFLACGTLWTGGATAVVWAVTAYAFLMVAFQIGIAGELKELGQPNERNLLRRLGSTVGPGLLGAASPTMASLIDSGAMARGDTAPFLLTSGRSLGLAFGMSLAKAVALAVIGALVGGFVFGYVVGAFSFMVLFAYTITLVRPGPFRRERRLRIMGIGEAASYLLLVLVLVPVLRPWLWVAFLLLPVLWFAGMNRALWARTGSVFAPGV